MNKNWVLLALLLLGAFLVRYLSFQRTSYAPGRDIYFHIIQARSLLEEGKTHAPDSSLTPSLMILAYSFTRDWETAPALLASLLCLIYTFLAWGATRQLFYSASPPLRDRLSLLLTAILAFSPVLTYVASEFIKQMMGMVSLTAFLWAMLWNYNEDQKYADTRESFPHQAGRRILMLVLALAAMFSHRLSGVLAFLGLLFALPPLWLMAGLGTGILVVVTGSLFLPGILSVMDATRLSGALQSVPVFHPALLARLLQPTPGLWLEMSLFYAAVICLIVYMVKVRPLRRDRFSWYLLGLGLLAVFPFYRMRSLDLGFRIFLGIVPLMGWIAGQILRHQTEERQQSLPVTIAALLLIGLSIPFSYLAFQPDKMLPYAQYRSIIPRAEQVFKELQPEMVIAHHGLCFYYTYLTYRHTLPYLIDWEVDPAGIYRLAYAVPREKVTKYLPNPAFQPLFLDVEYSIFREDDWQVMLQSSTNDREMQFRMKNGKNPYQKRPGYLSRFQKHTES